MENNFDKHIREKLENLEPAFQPSDWNRMEEMLDAQAGNAPELEDVYLDGIAYDSLHNLEVPYDPSSWTLIEQKLRDPYALRRRLVKYKVVEIAVFLLFIVTFIQFLPSKQSAPTLADTVTPPLVSTPVEERSKLKLPDCKPLIPQPLIHKKSRLLLK